MQRMDKSLGYYSGTLDTKSYPGIWEYFAGWCDFYFNSILVFRYLP